MMAMWSKASEWQWPWVMGSNPYGKAPWKNAFFIWCLGTLVVLRVHNNSISISQNDKKNCVRIDSYIEYQLILTLSIMVWVA